MGAHREYPQFGHLSMDDWTELLRLAKLSPEQKELATQVVIWNKMPLADIAEIHGVDRRTVARWMEREIIPELERFLPYLKKQAV